MFGRTKIAMLVAEFFGAATLTTVVLSVANSRIGFPLFIASAAGLAAGLLVLLLGNISGAHANPAVTVGMWSLRRIQTTQAIAFIAAQVVGGLAALTLYQYLTGQELSNLTEKIFNWPLFWAEALGAFIFVFGFSAAVIQRLDNWSWAFAVGASFTIGIIAASIASNALINPAIAVGVRSLGKEYLVGPLAGALVGANVYHYFFAPRPKSVAAKVKSVTKKVTRRKK